MIKKIVFACLLLSAHAIYAQQAIETDKNALVYLKGAVPIVNNKVVFKQEIPVPGANRTEIFEAIRQWAGKRFQPQDDFHARIAFEDARKGDLVALGEEYIVFSSTAISLDRTRIYYMLTIHATDQQCELSLSRIRYWYNEARNGGEKYNAEDWITDKMALNKKETKLAPITGKFRRGTIDLKNELFASAEQALSALRRTSSTITQPSPAITSSANIKLQANDEMIELPAYAQVGYTEILGKKIVNVVVEKDKIAINAFLNQYKTFRMTLSGQWKECTIIESKPLEETQRDMYGEAFNNRKNYTVYVCEIK